MSAVIRLANELLLDSFGAEVGHERTETVVPHHLAVAKLQELDLLYRALVTAAKEALSAMDIARDCIQPITTAQIKLHGLNPQTDKILDNAAMQLISCLKAVE